MASRRNLKKSVNNLTFELVAECLTYKHFHQDKKHDKTDHAMDALISKRNELIYKINHEPETADPKKLKVYYQEVIKEMNDMVLLMEKIG